MELKFDLSRERSRFRINIRCDDFDGQPGLDEVWFDGINEPITSDVAVLAGWMLLAPFVSQKLRCSVRAGRPLVNRIITTWSAPLEIGPIDDEPARFPQRTGTLYVGDHGDESSESLKSEQPVYRMRLLPINASGTVYAGPDVAVKTNGTLLGQGLVAHNVSHLLAPAIIYADFLGIANIAVPRPLIDVPPPMKRLGNEDRVSAWQELLKAAGFNLVVKG